MDFRSAVKAGIFLFLFLFLFCFCFCFCFFFLPLSAGSMIISSVFFSSVACLSALVTFCLGGLEDLKTLAFFSQKSVGQW